MSGDYPDVTVGRAVNFKTQGLPDGSSSELLEWKLYRRRSSQQLALEIGNRPYGRDDAEALSTAQVKWVNTLAGVTQTYACDFVLTEEAGPALWAALQGVMVEG